LVDIRQNAGKFFSDGILKKRIGIGKVRCRRDFNYLRKALKEANS
jgi:hypothetical protein